MEFVSANPTGPLHVGHGRLAALGDCLARLLEATGHEVWREYYVNDAGRQLAVLGLSVWLRMVEQAKGAEAFPEGAYRGEYIRDLAARVANELPQAAEAARRGMEWPEKDGATNGEADRYVDALINAVQELLGKELFSSIGRIAGEWVLEDIREDLEEFGVRFDSWQSERELVAGGQIDECLKRLEDVTYRRDGRCGFRPNATAMKRTAWWCGRTVAAPISPPDIAYHYAKRKRGRGRAA